MTERIDLAAIQARAELTRRRAEDLSLRGILAPADGPRRVPMALGESLAPAVEWILAELEQYEGLQLGHPDGRVSASCDTSEHPTWLRKPDDTRGCPWCEMSKALEVLNDGPQWVNDRVQQHWSVPARNAAEILATALADDSEPLDSRSEPCGEGHCICYGIGHDHAECACGCDCPRDIDGQLIDD